jgi:hypothetical protein
MPCGVELALSADELELCALILSDGRSADRTHVLECVARR